MDRLKRLTGQASSAHIRDLHSNMDRLKRAKDAGIFAGSKFTFQYG